VNLAHLLDGHADDGTALVSRGKPVSFRSLREDVDRTRGALAGLGLEPGDRVALICANNPIFVTAYLAVLGRGGVAVPLNPTSPAVELRRQLAAVGARAAVVGPQSAGAVAQLDRVELGDLEHVLVPPGVDLDGAVRLDDLPSEPSPVVERAADDLAVLIFTAGTAGYPKAAMLTHGNLRSNIEQAQQVPGRRLESDDVSLGVLPLFHIFGLNVVLGMSLAAGARVVLVERFDPVSALETIRGHGCTVVAGAPPMWTAWSVLPEVDGDAFASVRLAVSGASKLPTETVAAMQRRFGLRVDEGYGLTEASPIVTSSVGEGAKAGSIGRPVPGVSIRLVEDGEDALLGDSGEIWVRGPNVFAGYWNDPEATADALTSDGWLRTGDVAVADDDGDLWIVDRAKDLIIVSGFNVFPAEVEEVLLEHPAIDAAAVAGVDHPHTGEAVKAWVVPVAGGQLDEDSVIEFCADRLARYKCPTKVMFVDEIPHGLGGKVLRRALR
jgi:long-chain acyl-CoA synthetase